MKEVQMQLKQLQFEVIWEELNTVQKWQRLAFLLEVEIKGILPRSDNIDLMSSGLWGISQTSGYLCQSAVKANLETNIEMDKERIRRDEILSVNKKKRIEQLS